MDRAEMTAILAAYEKLRRADGLLKGVERLTPCAIMISPDDSDRVVDRVHAFERDKEGWSRRESRAFRTPTPTDDLVLPSDGRPVDGEWVEDETTSHRLVRSGAGYRLITISEVPDDAQGAVPVLREQVDLIATRMAGAARLSYAVYWGTPQDEDGAKRGIRRLAARFLGFDVRKDEK
jgi:hypothetical protein